MYLEYSFTFFWGKTNTEGIRRVVHSVTGKGLGNNPALPGRCFWCCHDFVLFPGGWDLGPCAVTLALLTSLLPSCTLYCFFCVLLLFIYGLVLHSPGYQPTSRRSKSLRFPLRKYLSWVPRELIGLRPTELTSIMWSSNHPSRLVFLSLRSD